MLPDVAVLSLLIGGIAVLGIVAQDTLLRTRDFRISTATSTALSFELRRWRVLVEIALWTLLVVVLALPLTALALTLGV